MKLLKELCTTYGPSGCENRIAAVIEREMKPLCDEITRDALGNLICHRRGVGKKLMLASHMDEIGLMVTYIEESGFLRCAEIGWLPPVFSMNRFVEFENGTVGVVAYEKEKEDKLKQSKLFIDIGATSREDAQKKVKVGDCAVMQSLFAEMGDRIASKALDNRVGCYALIEAAKRINSNNDIYFVFTVQEEVGLRGARAAAFSINPDLALSVDTTMTGDTPESDRVAVVLGGGTAIKVMDNSVISGAQVRNSLVALSCDIPHQMEVLEAGGTDGCAIHTEHGGILTGGVSIPVRYLHSVVETADKSDIENTIRLITAFAEA